MASSGLDMSGAFMNNICIICYVCERQQDLVDRWMSSLYTRAYHLKSGPRSTEVRHPGLCLILSQRGNSTGLLRYKIPLDRGLVCCSKTLTRLRLLLCCCGTHLHPPPPQGWRDLMAGVIINNGCEHTITTCHNHIQLFNFENWVNVLV